MTEAHRRYVLLAVAAAGALALAIGAVALIELVGSAYLSGRSASSGASSIAVTAQTTEVGGDSAPLSLHETPRPLPELKFADGGGRPLTLADFRGKVVLLNIWATWCGPCRREMPTLDRLQATLGGPDFEVVALSIDRAGIEVVTSFYAEIGVAHLAKYIDESGKAAPQLEVIGLPTTLLIDDDGREIGRLVGPAEWDAREMMAFFRQQLSRVSGMVRPGAARSWAFNLADRPVAASALSRNLQRGCLDLPVAGTTTSLATVWGVLA